MAILPHLLALNKSIIEHHVSSHKYQRGKERIANKVKREKKITKLLKAYDREHHRVGEMLPDSVRIYHIHVITTMLKAGVSLNKLDKFRDLLEENVLSLTKSSSHHQLLLFILQSKMQKLKQEIEGKHVSVLFDGTTMCAKHLWLCYGL